MFYFAIFTLIVSSLILIFLIMTRIATYIVNKRTDFIVFLGQLLNFKIRYEEKIFDISKIYSYTGYIQISDFSGTIIEKDMGEKNTNPEFVNVIKFDLLNYNQETSIRFYIPNSSDTEEWLNINLYSKEITPYYNLKTLDNLNSEYIKKRFILILYSIIKNIFLFNKKDLKAILSMILMVNVNYNKN